MLTLALSLITGMIGLFALSAVLSLLVLLGAAALSRRSSPAASTPLLLAVIVPAHDEGLVLAGTLASLQAQSYPKNCFEIVVVADNCADSTAAIARAHGVTVLERINLQERGKGYALNYAISHLLAQPTVADGFIIIDADTQAAPDFLACMSVRISQNTDPRGLGAWQGRYGVLNARDGWRAALMTAAFDLVNHVKPLGRDTLGLSAGLKGNGMAFTRAVAEQLSWPGGSLTEDLDYGLELARRFGLRVEYVPEARVQAQMPATAAQAASQRSRWERGRFGLVKERALPLLGEGVRRRSLLLLDAAWDLLTPPLADLAALLLLFTGLTAFGTMTHLLLHPDVWLSAAASGLVGLCVYVLGGLRVAGAGADTYTALARAPFYALWKFALLFTKSGPEWVRTERVPLSPDTKTVSETPLP